MELEELKYFLDEKVAQYNSPEFIQNDPIIVPHSFDLKEDVEIIGFFSAMIAWGQRKTIINNAKRIAQIMGDSPYDFIMSSNENDLKRFENFKHRTFNYEDMLFFIRSLKNIYTNHGGLENVFSNPNHGEDMYLNIEYFRNIFLESEPLHRAKKHVSSPLKGSACKRINMYLRWMVRDDNRGVDFGIWKSISMSKLSCPLDVHSGNIARKIGILSRKQNDWKAVQELDETLRYFDANDPSKYDFALFGLGVNEEF